MDAKSSHPGVPAFAFSIWIALGAAAARGALPTAKTPAPRTITVARTIRNRKCEDSALVTSTRFRLDCSRERLIRRGWALWPSLAPVARSAYGLIGGDVPGAGAGCVRSPSFLPRRASARRGRNLE